MNTHDAEIILTLARYAAMADGFHDDAERAAIDAAAARFGAEGDYTSGGVFPFDAAGVRTLVAPLSDEEARRTAYETAAAICHADGVLNPDEAEFLRELSSALGVDPEGIESAETLGDVARASTLPTAIAATEATAAAAHTAVAGDELDVEGATLRTGEVDTFILDQAILAGACELLPDRLANLAILPLQLRLVYRIGKRRGQEMDASQVKDLAATLGIGAAAQVMESVVRRTLGGLTGGVLGRAVGGATGVAAGAAVSFAATYALGHAAEQYYAQGRRLGAADLKVLFTRFQGEANALYPQVEQRIQSLARGTQLSNVLEGLQR